jgi:hypothetical protein
MRRTTFNLMLLSSLGALGTVAGCPADNVGSTATDASASGVTMTTFDTGDTNPGDGDGDTTNGDGDGDPPGDGDGDDSGCPPGGCLDIGGSNTTGGSGCVGDGVCNQIDLLFVVDNSGTMGEEQINLSANFPLLIDKLQMLTDMDGMPLNPDVNIMVTTTDVGHPQCTPFQPDGYEPAQGAPQSEACINRLDDFEGLGSNAPSVPQACTNGCPVAVEPIDSFIHFEGPMASTTNVPGNNIKGALSCIGPQGINGCGYEAQLEGMLQAINPGAMWNQGNKPFLRDGAILAIAIITDEVECSVRSPEGYAYFTDQMQNTYWEINPETGTKTQATSAVCQNAGVNCGAPDGNGIYADCNSIDTGVLHPLSRYLTYLQDELIANQNKEVIMLGILGVPEVTAHNPAPPYQPTAGGVMDLVYRQWKDGAYPVGDLLPDDIDDEETALTKEFEFGIGPGCTGEDGMGGYSGQALPNVRVQEVCEALNEGEDIRCCIESVCDTDFSDAISCLTGIIQTVVVPIG